MRELDRLKVIQAVVDTGLKPDRATGDGHTRCHSIVGLMREQGAVV